MLSQLVGNAGRTMGDVVAQVRRVNDMLSEIRTPTNEQTIGIGQVNDAVTQLDEATQQNAALGEESPAVAESLKQQAARLLSSVFKVRPRVQHVFAASSGSGNAAQTSSAVGRRAAYGTSA